MFKMSEEGGDGRLDPKSTQPLKNIGIALLVVGALLVGGFGKQFVDNLSRGPIESGMNTETGESGPGAPPDSQTLDEQGYGSGDGEDVLPADSDPENQATDVASDKTTAQWVIAQSMADSGYLAIKCPHCGSLNEYPYTTCHSCGKEYRIPEYTCSKCSGKGKVTCNYCLGKYDRGVCGRCKGKGYFMTGHPVYGAGLTKNKCYDCNGMGKDTCSMCMSGLLPCEICEGKPHYSAID